MHTPSQSWLQATIGYEDGCTEKGIPTMITWGYGGKEVAVEGSWDNWKTRFQIFNAFYIFLLKEKIVSSL